jgi:hypothetical protein
MTPKAQVTKANSKPRAYQIFKICVLIDPIKEIKTIHRMGENLCKS